MKKFEDLYEILKKDYSITINNNSSKNIIFFGNCQVITMAYYLNSITKEYNIHIILSWLFDKEGLDKFNMNEVNDKIRSLVKNCDIFIYHDHIKSYGVSADNMVNIVNKNAVKINLPVLQLHFNTNENSDHFYFSLNKLKKSIKNSNLKEFIFIYKNYKNIRFFNTNEHPTYFIMYLMSIQLYYLLKNNNKKIGLKDYYNKETREDFKRIIDHVILPGKIEITDEISKKTGMSINSDYFDII